MISDKLIEVTAANYEFRFTLMKKLLLRLYLILQQFLEGKREKGV